VVGALGKGASPKGTFGAPPRPLGKERAAASAALEVDPNAQTLRPVTRRQVKGAPESEAANEAAPRPSKPTLLDHGDSSSELDLGFGGKLRSWPRGRTSIAVLAAGATLLAAIALARLSPRSHEPPAASVQQEEKPTTHTQAVMAAPT